MIDILAMLLSVTFLFTIASIVSAVLGALTWLALRRPHARRKRFVLAALLLPLGTAAWLLLCETILHGESLFGDISEPLPHGFTIAALGKMREYGSIEDGNRTNKTVTLPPCFISKVALEGSRVFGECSPPFSPLERPPGFPFFVFDTETGHLLTFKTADALESGIGHPVPLTDLQFFHSPLATKRRVVNGVVGFLPPAFVFTALVFAVVYERRRARVREIR